MIQTRFSAFQNIYYFTYVWISLCNSSDINKKKQWNLEVTLTQFTHCGTITVTSLADDFTLMIPRFSDNADSSARMASEITEFPLLITKFCNTF